MITLTISAPNEAAARAALNAINRTINNEWDALWQLLGPMLRGDVQNRIRTQDGGRWAPASKWIRAKKGRSKLLPGEERGVTFRTFPRRLEVLHTSRGPWGINQHDAGFTEPASGQRVTIPIRDPSPLSLPSSAKAFSFISKNASRVPARKVWPEFSDIKGRFDRITSMWIQRTILKVPGVRP